MSKQFYRQQLYLLLFMYLGYAGFLLLKTSIIVAGPDILKDPALGLTKTEWGAILGYGTLGGILGKLVSGWTADKVGGKIVFNLGILVTTLGVAGFSLKSEYYAFALIYFIILMANASGWPSMAKLINNWYSPNQYGRVWGAISTASRVGTITATLTVGALLQMMDWRHMLLVSCTIGCSLVLMVLFFIKEQPPQKIIANEITSGTKISNINEYLHHPFYETTIKQAFFIFIRDKRFLLIASSMMGLTILWDFLNFVPLYLNEILNISTSESATATAAFPIGSLISVLIGGFLFDKLSKQAISYAMGCYLGVAVLSLTFLLALPHFELNLRTNLIATLAALFLFGFTVSPAYYLPMSIFSIEYGGPHTGILIALLDAIGFAASVVFSFVGGRISNQTGGWFYFLFLLIIIAIFSWAVTFWFLIGEAKQTVSISRN